MGECGFTGNAIIKPFKALFDKRGRVSLSGLFLRCSNGEFQVFLCVLSATDTITIQFCIIRISYYQCLIVLCVCVCVLYRMTKSEGGESADSVEYLIINAVVGL